MKFAAVALIATVFAQPPPYPGPQPVPADATAASAADAASADNAADGTIPEQPSSIAQSFNQAVDARPNPNLKEGHVVVRANAARIGAALDSDQAWFETESQSPDVAAIT